jgi:hypothetical protein
VLLCVGIVEQVYLLYCTACTMHYSIHCLAVRVLLNIVFCYFTYRLVATHYPHHCLVGDWLNEEMVDRLQASLTLLSMPSTSCPVEELSQGTADSIHGCLFLFEYKSYFVLLLRVTCKHGCLFRARGTCHVQTWLLISST